MSGTKVIGELLRANPALTAKIAANDIERGRQRPDAPMKAILVRSVSVVERTRLKRAGWVRTVERVSVRIRAGSYADQVALVTLVRSACAGFTGAAGGVVNVAVIAGGAGPDVDGPGGSFERTQDFRVGFDAPA